MPTILERIRPGVRDTTDDAKRTLAKAADAVAGGTSQAGDALASAAADMTGTVTETAGTLAGRVSDAASSVVDRLAGAAADADRVRGDAARAAGKAVDNGLDDVRGAVGRTGKELDATFREAKARVAAGVPIDEVVRRLERQWPGTDRDRYDRAFDRGFARGRSGRLAVGLIVGAASAAAGTWLLDPERGAVRRAALGRRMRRMVDDGRRALADRGLLANGASPHAPMTGVAVGPGRTAATHADTFTTSEDDPRIAVPAGAADADRGAWHREIET